MWKERDVMTTTMTADQQAPTTSNNQLKKGLWLGLQGGGAAEGEGTSPMQEKRIMIAMAND
jgi:hypothetical protein